MSQPHFTALPTTQADKDHARNKFGERYHRVSGLVGTIISADDKSRKRYAAELEASLVSRLLFCAMSTLLMTGVNRESSWRRPRT